MTAGGIRSEGILTGAIKWEELEALKLSYFSSGRDGGNGWMQLKLKGRGVRLRVESTISDFEVLVSICASMALIQNVTAVGIDPEGAFMADLQNMEKTI